ncbi:MAG TPA: type II toxin-antitoxin system antitoxin SocA domain-containing protein [Rugosimonospora sp.]|nr:type II toxin-antitoxin system antitoxin SocA domain-containing protein [Rugosimonospora sp.]
MAASARDVAAVLRRRLPGLGTVKLHKLLYYCQGHHLAAFDRPLFRETISAWDMGPVVGTLWKEEKQDHTPEPEPLDEAALNTIGYVISRYGGLSGKDLENLTHSEAPWQEADRERSPGGRATIRTAWIRDYFRADGAPAAGEDAVPLDREAVRAWLARAPRRAAATPDSREEIMARRAENAAGPGGE